MPDFTTAQRLAAYRDELKSEGFTTREAWDLVESVAPSLYEDLAIQADIDDTEHVASVNVRMVADVDTASLEHAADKVERFIRSASMGGSADD